MTVKFTSPTVMATRGYIDLPPMGHISADGDNTETKRVSLVAPMEYGSTRTLVECWQLTATMIAFRFSTGAVST
ncbi:hypothetical protein BJL96_39045 [Burkholderia cenocepacia]|nr:hypothetical protein A3203_14890 [Burkholderia cenocepacia]AOK64549.1 hypothetical protein WM33_02730 [Burkholderia multivorans]KVR78288.1 hypothetical protein WK26_19725 [Burkholderia vietnamiensis]KVS04074.1 hypothetical protein WK29_26325 [Burkholderia vietnamiensis]KVS44723.1 hypothetical protein WK35_22925 [Burkholderia vietnamiensis]